MNVQANLDRTVNAMTNNFLNGNSALLVAPLEEGTFARMFGGPSLEAIYVKVLEDNSMAQYLGGKDTVTHRHSPLLKEARSRGKSLFSSMVDRVLERKYRGEELSMSIIGVGEKMYDLRANTANTLTIVVPHSLRSITSDCIGVEPYCPPRHSVGVTSSVLKEDPLGCSCSTSINRPPTTNSSLSRPTTAQAPIQPQDHNFESNRFVKLSGLTRILVKSGVTAKLQVVEAVKNVLRASLRPEYTADMYRHMYCRKPSQVVDRSVLIQFRLSEVPGSKAEHRPLTQRPRQAYIDILGLQYQGNLARTLGELSKAADLGDQSISSLELSGTESSIDRLGEDTQAKGSHRTWRASDSGEQEARAADDEEMDLDLEAHQMNTRMAAHWASAGVSGAAGKLQGCVPGMCSLANINRSAMCEPEFSVLLLCKKDMGSYLGSMGRLVELIKDNTASAQPFLDEVEEMPSSRKLTPESEVAKRSERDNTEDEGKDETQVVGTDSGRSMSDTKSEDKGRAEAQGDLSIGEIGGDNRTGASHVGSFINNISISTDEDEQELEDEHKGCEHIETHSLPRAAEGGVALAPGWFCREKESKDVSGPINSSFISSAGSDLRGDEPPPPPQQQQQQQQQQLPPKTNQDGREEDTRNQTKSFMDKLMRMELKLGNLEILTLFSIISPSCYKYIIPQMTEPGKGDWMEKERPLFEKVENLLTSTFFEDKRNSAFLNTQFNEVKNVFAQGLTLNNEPSLSGQRGLGSIVLLSPKRMNRLIPKSAGIQIRRSGSSKTTARASLYLVDNERGRGSSPGITKRRSPEIERGTREIKVSSSPPIDCSANKACVNREPLSPQQKPAMRSLILPRSCITRSCVTPKAEECNIVINTNTIESKVVLQEIEAVEKLVQRERVREREMDEEFDGISKLKHSADDLKGNIETLNKEIKEQVEFQPRVASSQVVDAMKTLEYFATTIANAYYHIDSDLFKEEAELLYGTIEVMYNFLNQHGIILNLGKGLNALEDNHVLVSALETIGKTFIEFIAAVYKKTNK